MHTPVAICCCRRAAAALAVCLIGVFGAPHSASAIVIGQVDDFEDGLTSDWGNGGAAPQPVNALGGPGGAADRFMQVTADGSGSGGKLVVFSRDRWIGDYLSAGVTGIEMDLMNMSSQTLQIRLALKQSSSIAGAGFASTTAYALPNDGRWHRAVFPINSSSLTQVGTIQGTLADVLGGGESGMREIRIMHSNGISLNGSTITGQLGVDNIRAIPGPGSAAATALAFLFAARRRRSSR